MLLFKNKNKVFHHFERRVLIKIYIHCIKLSKYSKSIYGIYKHKYKKMLLPMWLNLPFLLFCLANQNSKEDF